LALWLKVLNLKPKVVDGQHVDCGGAMVSKLPNAVWPKGAFVETIKVWQHEWFYIIEPRDANWAATPGFRSGPPTRLTSWTAKGLDWGSKPEVKVLQKRISDMLGENNGLTNVIQVMLFRRILPCQLRASPMWEFDPEKPRTLKHFFGTTHEDIWKQLFKAQKKWPKKNEDIGLDIENPATAVRIIFPKTYPINISDMIEIISPAFFTGLDGKGGADQLSGTAA
jgi:hypothetical protein